MKINQLDALSPAGLSGGAFHFSYWEEILPVTRTLPSNPEGTNDNRAKWAAIALRHFQRATGTDYEDVLGDLLCDLMHWSDRNNFDFELALDRARGHYRAETEGDTPA